MVDLQLRKNGIRLFLSHDFFGNNIVSINQLTSGCQLTERYKEDFFVDDEGFGFDRCFCFHKETETGKIYVFPINAQDNLEKMIATINITMFIAVGINKEKENSSQAFTLRFNDPIRKDCPNCFYIHGMIYPWMKENLGRLDRLEIKDIQEKCQEELDRLCLSRSQVPPQVILNKDEIFIYCASGALFSWTKNERDGVPDSFGTSHVNKKEDQILLFLSLLAINTGLREKAN